MNGLGDKVRTIEVNARWIPREDAATMLSDLSPGDTLMQGNVCLAACATTAPEGSGRILAAQDNQRLLNHANELFSLLGQQLKEDVSQAAKAWSLSAAPALPHTLIIGQNEDLWVADSAKIHAASIDTEQGAVVIGPNTTIEVGTHLKGPLVIGEGATIRMGARISGPSSIGPHCKVGGEISNVNFQGWANKAHDGFLGNSVIGRWCNLGAGTESSNLKNTYGEVKQWDQRSGSLQGTGLQFCGLLMGDHSKCGIGTTFNTGTVVDPACVIFDSGFPPKHLPPFSWYDARKEDMQIQALDRMLNTATKVMARREERMTEAERDNLTRLFEERAQSGS